MGKLFFKEVSSVRTYVGELMYRFWRSPLGGSGARNWIAGIFMAVAVIAVVPMLSNFLPTELLNWATNNLGKTPLGIAPDLARMILFAYIGLNLLLYQPAKMHEEIVQKNNALLESQKPRLKIFFQERDPFRQVDPAHLAPDRNAVVGNLVLYRIAIQNLSPTVTIKDVCLELESTDPDSGIHFLPVPLHLMHDNPSSGQPQRTRFDLNPGQIQHADLISRIEGAPQPYILYNGQMQIWHAVPGVSNVIRSGNYRLTIHAHASNCPEVRAVFLAGTDAEGNFFFRPE